VVAQKSSLPTIGYTNLTIGYGGTSLGVELNLANNTSHGKRKNHHIELGLGTRFTSFYRKDAYFVTVPGAIDNPNFIPLLYNYGSSSKIAHDDPLLMDSVYVSSPRIYSTNLYFNFSIQFEKLRFGINTDLVGFSFGESRNGIYINGTVQQNVHVVPRAGNSIFQGEAVQGIGSLNSEAFVAYQLFKNVSVKLSLQMIRMEYQTDTKVQQFPGPNDRFRTKVNTASVGIVYMWRKRGE
jgi:hypothetical protein